MSCSFNFHLVDENATVAMGNKLAGSFSPYMEKIAETSSMADFFQILVYIPIGAGLLLYALSFPLKKLMHGIK